MPCCSAYDALSNKTPLEPTTSPDATASSLDAAAPSTIAAPEAGGPGPHYDCREHRCYEELEGDGKACPPGQCRRNERKEPAPLHPRPKCRVHDDGGPHGGGGPRPFGTSEG